MVVQCPAQHEFGKVGEGKNRWGRLHDLDYSLLLFHLLGYLATSGLTASVSDTCGVCNLTFCVLHASYGCVFAVGGVQRLACPPQALWSSRRSKHVPNHAIQYASDVRLDGLPKARLSSSNPLLVLEEQTRPKSLDSVRFRRTFGLPWPWPRMRRGSNFLQTSCFYETFALLLTNRRGCPRLAARALETGCGLMVECPTQTIGTNTLKCCGARTFCKHRVSMKRSHCC